MFSSTLLTTTTTIPLLLLLFTLPSLSTAALFKVYANAAYDNSYGDVFEFVPNELTAAVGDTLEFHFTGPGLGVLGGNHSVAMGDFNMPCVPAREGFFSGYMAVNATSKEANQVFQVPITNTDPMVFYCTQGRHCAMGMYGVVNGAGSQTRKAYADIIPTTNLFATAPDSVGGGMLLPNNASNIVGPSVFDGKAVGRGSMAGGMVAMVVGLVVVAVVGG